MNPPQPITVDLGHLEFGALTWGPEDGPLVLCLHGYPDTAWTWRHVAPALAAQGHYVVAPFLRGYAPTSIPADRDGRVGALARDALALAERLRPGTAFALVGHDWGAIAASCAAVVSPERISYLVTLAVPPPQALRDRIAWRNLGWLLRQVSMSWYAIANQVPLMAEAAMPRLMPLIWRRWSPGYDATEDLAHLARALPDRRHWSMALGYYRAAARPWTWGRSPYATEQAGWLVTPTMPLLYLHGRNDGCVGVAAADGVAAALAPGSEVAVIDGCGHFLQLEDPSEIAARIVSWINPERTA